jgi:hypothetical protein
LSSPLRLLPSVQRQSSTSQLPITSPLSGQAQENGAPNGSKAPVKGTTVGEIKATGSAERQQQTIDKPEPWGSRFWCEVNASDWFIGLFTLLLAIATYFLWRETERLAAGADDQSKKMVAGINATLAVADKTKEVADAMQDAASAMRYTAGVSEAAMNAAQKSSERQLRAYVHVYEITRAEEWEDQFRVGINVKNYGQTPAYGVVIRALAGQGPWPDVKEIPGMKEGLRQIGDLKERMVLGPSANALMSYGLKENISEDAMKSIREGTAAMYIYGFIKYVDAFGETRHTYFNYAYERDALVTTRLCFAHHGNTAD